MYIFSFVQVIFKLGVTIQNLGIDYFVPYDNVFGVTFEYVNIYESSSMYSWDHLSKILNTWLVL